MSQKRIYIYSGWVELKILLEPLGDYYLVFVCVKKI